MAQQVPSPTGSGERPVGEADELRVLRALRRIMRALDLHSRRLVVQHKITYPQLVCLLAVERLGPVGVGALAGEVHLSASTVIGILDRLETRGLIARRRDGRDRRVVHVNLTAAGQIVVRNAPSPLQDTLVEAMRRQSEEERWRIASALERVVEWMEAGGVSAAPILTAGPIGDTDVAPDQEGGDVPMG